MNRHMSQEKLAELLNITPSHLKHIESEHRKPSLEVLFKAVVLLDISLDALLFPEGEGRGGVIHTDGLTAEEAGALAQLVDAMKRGRRAEAESAEVVEKSACDSL